MICSRGRQDKERKENSSFIFLLLFNSFTYHIENGKSSAHYYEDWLLLHYCSSSPHFPALNLRGLNAHEIQSKNLLQPQPPSKSSTFETCKMFLFSIRHHFPTYICASSEFFYFATFMRAHSNGIFVLRVVGVGRLTWIFVTMPFSTFYSTMRYAELFIGRLKIIFSYCIVMVSSYMICTLRNHENCLWIFNNVTYLWWFIINFIVKHLKVEQNVW